MFEKYYQTKSQSNGRSKAEFYYRLVRRCIEGLNQWSARERQGHNTGLRELIPEAVCVHAKNVRVNMRLASKNKHVSIDGLSKPEVKNKIDHLAAINKKVVN